MQKFSKEVQYTGRNGTGRQKGIDVELFKSVVFVRPVNSKGDTANCEIQVPVEDLDELILGLMQLSQQHKKKREASVNLLVQQ